MKFVVDKQSIKQSEELVNRLEALQKEVPKIKQECNAIRQGAYWQALENLRKAKAIQMNVDQAQEKVYEVERKISELSRPLSHEIDKIRSQLEALTSPFIQEALDLLKEDLQAIPKRMTVRLVKKEKNILNDSLIYVIRTNIEDIKNLMDKVKVAINEIRTYRLRPLSEVQEAYEHIRQVIETTLLKEGEEQTVSSDTFHELMNNLPSNVPLTDEAQVMSISEAIALMGSKK
jgi:hypothetical protein